MGNCNLVELAARSETRSPAVDRLNAPVTVITVNYNSMPKLDIMISCFEAMLELRWRPLQIVCVDNGSTDVSFDKIEDFASKKPHDEIDVVFLRLSKNIGFARANNEGFLVSNPTSKYIAVMNNDLAPDPDSLNHLIDFLESRQDVGGVQPVVLDWSGLRINTAGCVFTVWGASGLGSGLAKNRVQIPFYASHIYGAYSVYSRVALGKTGGLFLPYFFMYGDDYELGIRLWANGYKLAVLPVDGGRHYGAATTGESKVNLYFLLKNETAVMEMYSGTISFLMLMRAFGVIGYSFVRNQKEKARAFFDGLLLGRRLRKALPKKMRFATVHTPRTDFSISDFVFMHTRRATRTETQQAILDKMIRKHPIWDETP